MRRRAIALLSLLAVCLESPRPARADSDDDIETAGDLLQFALPTSGYLMTHLYDDPAGRWMFWRGFATAQGTVQVMKHVISKTRPNGGDHSFPSGHTTAAFQGASFIQRRYGWGWGAPAYALASFVGWSRVQAVKHDEQDVLTGAALGIFSTYLFTDPFEIGDTKLEVKPLFGSDILGLNFVFGGWEDFELPEGQAPEPVDKNVQMLTGSDPTRIVDSVQLKSTWWDTADGDGYRLALGGTLAVGSNQFGLELAYVNSDFAGFQGLGFGDMLLSYKNTCYVDDEAAWWEPRAVTVGVDQVLPTGLFDEGTGAGSWILAPELRVAWTLVEGFSVYPGVVYVGSLYESDPAPETSYLNVPVRIEYKFQNGVYAYWEPGIVIPFVNNPDGDDDVVGDHRVELGVPMAEGVTLFTQWEFSGLPRGSFDPALGITRFYDSALHIGLRYFF